MKSGGLVSLEAFCVFFAKICRVCFDRAIKLADKRDLIVLPRIMQA